jgi:hypothetical protein
MILQIANEKLRKLRHLLFMRHLYERGMEAKDINQADLEQAVNAANVALQMVAGAPRTNGAGIFSGPAGLPASTPQFDSATVTMELVDAALSGT